MAPPEVTLPFGWMCDRHVRKRARSFRESFRFFEETVQFSIKVHLVVHGHSASRDSLFCLTQKVTPPAGPESPQDSQEVLPPGHLLPLASVTRQTHRHLKGRGPGSPLARLGTQSVLLPGCGPVPVLWLVGGVLT